MTEQERERLIDARVHVERIRDAGGDWVGADMEWHESIHGLSAADVDEIETEAYRRHHASRQEQPATPVPTTVTGSYVEPVYPATPDLDDVVFDPLAGVTITNAFPMEGVVGTPLTAEDVNAAGFGIPVPSQTVLTVDWEEIARLQRQQLLLPRVPEPAILPFRLTPDTERMLARLINPTTLGERLCRAFLMGDEVALQALADGIKGGEIEVQP